MKKILVIGKPIKHSKSPLIHNRWIKKRKIECIYGKEELEEANLKKIIKKVKDKQLIGFNVTVPYKEKIKNLIQENDEFAEASGAVNTVYMKNNVVIGSNTDGEGFIMSLKKDLDYEINKKTRVFVVGAGGAARGIIYSILKRNIKELTITNRKEENIYKLINDLKKHINCKDIKIENWKTKKVKSNIDLVVNASSYGMKKEDKLFLNIDSCKKDACFYDIIYSPLKTDFLKRAEQKNYKIENGIGMLIRQAALSFEKWFDLKITEDEIKIIKKKLAI